MKTNEIFKKVLENEMPDIEAVREKCVSNSFKKNKYSIISFNSLKFVLPAVACLVLVVIAVFYIQPNKDDTLFLAPPNSYNGEDFSAIAPTNTKELNNDYTNSYYTSANTPETKSELTTTRVEQITGHSYLDNDFESIRKKNYVSYNNFDEFLSFTSYLQVVGDDVVCKNSEAANDWFVLNIDKDELSMFLEEKSTYYFSVDSKVVCDNITLEENIADGYTGCSVTVRYNGTAYELGYSTHKVTKQNEAIESFYNSQGHLINKINDDYYTSNIDGYHFYIKSLSDDSDNIKDFIDNLLILYNSID